MLLKMLQKLARGAVRGSAKAAPDPGLLDRAMQLAQGGDLRAAIKAYREYLAADPANPAALNGLAACLSNLGDLQQATELFEMAYSMDDTYIPAVVNRAKLLIDFTRGAEALTYLKRAKVVEPHFLHTDAVYAGLCFKTGDPARARGFQARASRSSFDNLRLANCYLFWTAYDDVSEATVAAEHRFWAETLLPPDVGEASAGPLDPGPTEGRRIRIGYWSPDLRGHSVRFFFRPLLEAHDRERFEIFLYHDFHRQDEQTAAMRAHADAFHDVYEMTDPDLAQLIRSHKLDILVELAGHTSANRLSLLHHRLATVQITALGYPPTTGLRSIDAKLIDRHVSTPEDPLHYSEEPLVLPSSFWCFDPKEPVSIADEPPVVNKGHITFGCVGNIAKITDRLLQAWKSILAAVPDSRLLIRSVSFEDSMALEGFRKRLERNSMPMDRIDLCEPKGGAAFFASYDEIDIILDTFPFNGGTTTCFAAYMGVPVVTLAGKSLLGRMGVSIMTNMGAPDLVVESLEAYVDRAIRLAGDPQAIRRFKKEARTRFAQTALGNAQQFAREYEAACLDLLARKRAGAEPVPDRVVPLPAKEIMRRAYEALRYNQSEAAERILAYCLRCYPDYAAAHVFAAQRLALDGDVPKAIESLAGWLASAPGADQVAARIALVRLHLLLGQREEAQAVLQGALQGPPVEDVFDLEQLRLYQAALQPETPEVVDAAGPCRVQVLVPCDDAGLFATLRSELLAACALPPQWSLEIRRVGEQDRITAYQEALQAAECDLLVFMQKNVRVHSRTFLPDLWTALAQADVVSFAGAQRWTRLDWRLQRFEEKAGSFCAPAGEVPTLFDLQVVGAQVGVAVASMAVLDGALLAMRPGALPAADWDEELAGCETLLEEAWVHGLAKAGARLAVHGALGVYLEPLVQLDASNRAEARLHCVETFGFDPLVDAADDFMALAVPQPSPADAARTSRRYVELPR